MKNKTREILIDSEKDKRDFMDTSLNFNVKFIDKTNSSKHNL